MNSITFLIFIFFMGSAIGQSYLKYSSDISNLDVGGDCKELLIKHYSENKDLSVKSISRLGQKLENYNNEDRKGRSLKHQYFFHYTNYKYKNYDSDIDGGEVFSYFKKMNLTSLGYNSFSAALYISNDPYSSSEFGKYLLRMKLSKGTVILHEKDFFNIDWSFIENKFQELSSVCGGANLIPLIVEDSGIDVIKYENNYNNSLWLQILNSRSILELKFTKKPKRLTRGFRNKDFKYDE